VLWSILIPAIPERYHAAHGLLFSLLESQSVMRMHDVELLYVMDNRRRSVGQKRNDLMAMALGEYVTFIDDDDEVATDYVQKIYRQIAKTRKEETPADVICFPQRCTLAPSGVVHMCSYSIAHWKDRAPENRRILEKTDEPNTLAWSGPPAHTMAWRRDLVKDFRFPARNFGEDVNWVDAVCSKAKSEIVLNGEPLYHYKFSETGTATR
jgi:glycosyltransferase involved in cell wall biosynthesis